MSLCCFPLFRGSRPKKAQSERGFSCFRRWRKSRRHQQLPPPGNIHPQVTVGSEGLVHPGQAPTGIPLGLHHTMYPSSCICVCVCVCVCEVVRESGKSVLILSTRGLLGTRKLKGVSWSFPRSWQAAWEGECCGPSSSTVWFLKVSFYFFPDWKCFQVLLCACQMWGGEIVVGICPSGNAETGS